MRVLIVSQNFWPESFRINDVVKTLVEKGLDVDVLAGKPNYPEGVIYAGYKAYGCSREEWHGAALYRVPIVPRGDKSAVRLAINYLSFVLSGMILGPALLRRRRYDVVFVYAPSPILQAIPAIFISWFNGCPLVLWVQDLWPESLSATGYVRNRLVLKIVAGVVRFIYRHADLLLVPSRAFEPHVAALAPGKSIAYFPNSVDEVFRTAGTGLPIGFPALQGFKVLFAGNVGTAQAVDVILEAATILRTHGDIHFVVVGTGSRWEWLSREVKIRGLENLHLPGRFPSEMMPGIMREASVLLVTLANRPIFAATVPSKVQAYMAAGKPIIASLNGEGARLVVESKSGLAVPAENAKDLAEAVLRLYAMPPAERDIFGFNGRRYCEQHFNHDRLLDQLIEHFNEVTAG